MAETSECPNKLGEICWLEIPVHDAARAQKLFADVFGWEFHADAMPAGRDGIVSFHMFSSQGKALNGALNLLEEGYQATKYGKLDKEVLPPLATFCVDECNATLEKVKSHGGKMQCPKTEIPNDMGFYARFTDTEGNVIGIWSQK